MNKAALATGPGIVVTVTRESLLVLTELGEGGAGVLRPFAPLDQILKCVVSDIIMKIFLPCCVPDPALTRDGCLGIIYC